MRVLYIVIAPFHIYVHPPQVVLLFVTRLLDMRATATLLLLTWRSPSSQCHHLFIVIIVHAVIAVVVGAIAIGDHTLHCLGRVLSRL